MRVVCVCVYVLASVCCVRDRLHPSVFIVYCTPGGARARENRSLKNTLFWGTAKFCGFLIAKGDQGPWSVYRLREGRGALLNWSSMYGSENMWAHQSVCLQRSPERKNERKTFSERQRVTTTDKRPYATIKREVAVVWFPSRPIFQNSTPVLGGGMRVNLYSSCQMICWWPSLDPNSKYLKQELKSALNTFFK